MTSIFSLPNVSIDENSSPQASPSSRSLRAKDRSKVVVASAPGAHQTAASSSQRNDQPLTSRKRELGTSQPGISNLPPYHNIEVPSGAASRRVREVFHEIDAEYFCNAKGDAATLSKCIDTMAVEKLREAALMMYHLLLNHTLLSEEGPLPDVLAESSPSTSRLSSAASSPSPIDVSQKFSKNSSNNPAAFAGLGGDNNNSSTSQFFQTAYSLHRSSSLTSFGGVSLVSVTRPPVQHTNKAEKVVDHESGDKKINEFLLLGTLGKGSQAKVKLAFDTERNVLRAIKVLRRPDAVAKKRLGGKDDETRVDDHLQRIEKEIAITKKLRHKHLVALYEVIDDPDHNKLYMVLQYVSRGPVTKSRGIFCDRFDEGKVLFYSRQLCSGLAYLHQHGVVHRDVKPENILVDDEDQTYLVDFGVSEMLQDVHSQTPVDDEANVLEPDDMFSGWSMRRQTLKGQPAMVHGCKGTPAFLAPELLMPHDDSWSFNSVADPNTSERSLADGYAVDIWALGVTFFQLLCGRLPWVFIDESCPPSNPNRYGFNIRSYFDSVCTRPPMFPPLAELVAEKEYTLTHYAFEEREVPISKPWQDLLTEMLCKDPRQRPTIAVVRRRVKQMRIGPYLGLGYRKSSVEFPDPGPQVPSSESSLVKGPPACEPAPVVALLGTAGGKPGSFSNSNFHETPETSQGSVHQPKRSGKFVAMLSCEADCLLAPAPNFPIAPLSPIDEPLGPSPRRVVESATVAIKQADVPAILSPQPPSPLTGKQQGVAGSPPAARPRRQTKEWQE